MPAMTERLSLCNVRAIVIASPPKAGVATKILCHCEAFHKESLAISKLDWLCQHILQPIGLENEIASSLRSSRWQASYLSLRAFCSAEGVAISFRNPFRGCEMCWRSKSLFGRSHKRLLSYRL